MSAKEKSWCVGTGGGEGLYHLTRALQRFRELVWERGERSGPSPSLDLRKCIVIKADGPVWFLF